MCFSSVPSRKFRADRAGRRFVASTACVLCFAALLALAACSGSSKGTAPAGAGDAPLDDAGDAAELQYVHPPQGMPPDAARFLAKSAVDSCSVCAKNSRKRAFEILEKRFPPGTIVRSDSASWFMRTSPDIHQLMLASDLDGDPTLTFRFHTPEDHLVGIAESDWTDEGVAHRVHTAPQGVVFRGALQVVPFPYGDGAGFLYHAPANSIELQCKVLELEWY
jgi:hypothetical protein